MITRNIKYLLLVCCACCTVSMTITSCTEDIDESNLYVFTGQTIEKYLQDNPEEFSNFEYVLSRTGYDKILSSYGQYTCFAPHNEAVKQYVDSLYEDMSNPNLPHNGMTGPGLEGLTDSLCNDIALYHLLYTKVLSVKLNSGASFPTILNRDINTSIDSLGDVLINNDTKLIMGQDNVDIELENGILHKVDHVFTRSNNMISGELGKLAGFELFYTALSRTGLADTLMLSKDTSYVEPKAYAMRRVSSGEGKLSHPRECKVGWTIFAETDEVLRAAGITDWASLEKHAREVYEGSAGWYNYLCDNGIAVSTGSDYENPWNVVNMWVRYHIVKSGISNDHLAYHDNDNKSQDTPAVNFFETMLPMTMIRVSYERNQQLYRINRAIRNASRSDLAESTGSVAIDHSELLPGIEIDKVQYQALNGYIHPIKKTLEYKAETLQCFKERMRFDAPILFPELLSNGFCHKDPQNVKQEYKQADGFDKDGYIHIPNDFSHSFLSYNGTETVIQYAGVETAQGDDTKRRRDLWEADEIIVKGKYDCAFRLPPVPNGTYEIRIGYKTIDKSSMHSRGMMQVFLGYKTTDRNQMEPLDIPLDMRTTPTSVNGMPDALTGWIDPTKTDDKGVETDAAMRYRGFMRAPFGMLGQASGRSSRYATGAEIPLRRILTTKELKQDVYWLRFKAVLEETLDVDYFELVPIEVYNDPQYTEDMY